MNRNVQVVKDCDGSNIVFIHDIIFKGRRSIEWKDVEKYLFNHVGDVYAVAETQDLVYIGKDLPDEYAHSNYTAKIHGTTAKAKANVVQGMRELVEIAFNKSHTVNKKKKHESNAKYGWYKYESRFALPVYNEQQDISHYNIYQAVIIVRHAEDEKMYLYDIINIKKRNEKPFPIK